MSAETVTVVPDSPEQRPGGRATRRSREGRGIRPVAGVLADGTVFYAPVGEVVTDSDLVVCHLCGQARRSVTAHLRMHGWTVAAYRERFGLERRQSLEGPGTRKRRAAAFTARLVFDPAVRAGSAVGRERARSGQLTQDAATAARGRRLPEQRRRKMLQALAAAPPDALARTNSERGRRHLAGVAAAVARDNGYPDIGTFVLERVAAGASLAAISREAGLGKDWLSRHLASIDPGGSGSGGGAAAPARPARCQVASGRAPGRVRRPAQLPAPAPHCGAPHGDRHRRRGRPDPPCRRYRAGPARAGPYPPRRQAARGR